MNTLYQLSPGDSARIFQLHTKGTMHRRLLDMGFTPGADITCLYESFCSDPKAYLIRHTVIALRKEDAQTVEIQREGFFCR